MRVKKITVYYFISVQSRNVLKSAVETLEQGAEYFQN